MERSGKWIHAAVIRKLRIPSLTPSQLFRVTRKLHSHADFVALDRFESQTVSAGGTLLPLFVVRQLEFSACFVATKSSAPSV